MSDHTLPPEVEAALTKLNELRTFPWFTNRAVPLLVGELDTLRAHITAQAEELAIRRGTSMNPPPWWKWEQVEGKTTPSGKTLYRCNTCGVEGPTPNKWEYHADVCFAELHRQAVTGAEEIELLREDKLLQIDAGGRVSFVECSRCAHITEEIERLREVIQYARESQKAAHDHAERVRRGE